MQSAFKTVLSALGVVAACYILASATWIQVLLLFLAACLGWCVFSSCSNIVPKTLPSFFARKKRSFNFDDESVEERPIFAEQTRQQSHRPAVYSFPIHQLSQ